MFFKLDLQFRSYLELLNSIIYKLKIIIILLFGKHLKIF
jgi:hypothetical protein